MTVTIGPDVHSPAPAALQGRGHTRESSVLTQSEQIGRDTPDLYPDERDPNTRDRGKHEDREPDIQKPSETASERTSGGDQDGGDVDDLVVEKTGSADRTTFAVDPADGPVGAFGPLKAVLESIFVFCAQNQVHFYALVQAPPLTVTSRTQLTLGTR